MPISSFDTLKYVRRLEQAGMPSALAEVQAEVLTEAFTVNLESLVTKEYLESRLDARFAEQRAYMDTRFAELKGDFSIMRWMLGIVLVGIALPYLERVLAL